MIRNVEEIFEPLRSLKVGDFVNRRSLPEVVIAAIDSLVDVFVTSDLDTRCQITHQVDWTFSFAFFLYAGRTAVESVRQNEPELLRRGLVALAIENLAFDYRDSLSPLSMIYCSARKFPQVRADELFQDVAGLSCSPFNAFLSGFIKTPETSKSITRFGWKESAPPALFDYEALPQKNAKGSRKFWLLIRKFRRLLPILR